MLIDFILYCVYSALRYTVLLPIFAFDDVTANPTLVSKIAEIKSYLSLMISIFPATTTLLSTIGLILIIEAGIMTYKIIMWIVRRIPTQS